MRDDIGDWVCADFAGGFVVGQHQLAFDQFANGLALTISLLAFNMVAV
jgi:hypothetical protein